MSETSTRSIGLFHLGLFVTVFCLFGGALTAQKKAVHPILVPSYGPKQSFKDFITKTPWLIHVQGNVVDDDGKPFSKVFDAKNSWNLFPSFRLAAEKECRYNWSIELAYAFNSLKTGKTLNNDVLTNGGTLMAIDLNGKKTLTRLYRIEPYLFSGFGYTMRSTAKFKNTATLNAGLGFNIWIIDNILGASIQSCGKFGLQSPLFKTGSNYLQHSAGLVWKLSGGDKERLKAAKAHLKSVYSK